MEIKLHDGGKGVQVSEQTFGAEFNEALVHQVVTAFMAGGRAGTKAQKNRSAVAGGGKKPWRQKGTGRARAGTIRSPLWRSGGVTFAATPRDHSHKVNRKMYRGAMRSILAELLRQERLIVVDEFKVDQPKTKLVQQKLRDMGVNDALIVVKELDDNLFLASRNLPKVYSCDVHALNPAALVGAERVIMSVDAVRHLEGWLS